MRRPLRTLMLLMTAWITSSAAQGQTLEGVMPLRTGFTPDPAILIGEAEGLASLPVRDPAECGVGYFARAPNHVLQLETRVGFMRFYATGPGDLAIAVRDAEGHWHCNDDRFGRHPSVEGTWTVGRVEVWVGTHEAGAHSDYQLRLTETRSMRPGVGPDSSDAGDQTDLARDAGLLIDAESGRFDGIRLRRGFLPDPRFLAGGSEVAEGEDGTDGSVLGGLCHGLISHAPSHVVTLLDDFDFLQMYLTPLDSEHWPVGEEPAFTMLLMLPDGTFVCDESADGVEIHRSTWPPGIYRVWVGTEHGESAGPYRMGISEIRRVR